MASSDLFGNLDVPSPDSVLSGAAVLVTGWALARRGRIASVTALLDHQPVGSTPVGRPRPDVASSYPDVSDSATSGFMLEFAHMPPGQHVLALRLTTDDGATEEIGHRYVYLTGDMHVLRRRAVRPLLACPACHASLHDEAEALICNACSRRTPLIEGVPVFEGGRETASQGPISASPYAPRALELITEYAEGLVLDCGAGYPMQSFANVVQFELFRFPSTDVAGDALHLPFADGVFDAVISQAVLEHVTDPFAYVRECYRVLKSGGKVLIDSAFLQPVHAYPYHFFNTTLLGLHEVTRDFELIEEGVGPHQQPWVMLRWVLGSYVAGVSTERERQALLGMTIGDVLNKLRPGAGVPPFDSMTPQAEIELAAGVFFLGRKGTK